MVGFLLRLLIGAFGLWVASELVDGMHIQGGGTLLLAAFLLGFANAVVRPVVILLTLPVTLLTLGLFLLVINAAMLALVAALLDSFELSGFPSALFGSIVVSLTSGFANWVIGPRGRVEILVVERRG
jgi:putative membrane protein